MPGRKLLALTLLNCLAVAACSRPQTEPAGATESTSSAERAILESTETSLPDKPVAPEAGDLSEDPAVASWVSVPELPGELALLPSVFWEPEDTTSLRKLIRETDLVKGRRVMEIGTGSGLISLCCLQAGAQHVVATDLNPAAVRNALQNADRLGMRQRFDCRPVPRRSPGAWTVLRDEEQFDLIISNPPWENQKPASVTEFALYDPGFELLSSLLTGARQRLKPGGQMLLAYGCVTAIRRIQEIGTSERLDVRILDDRSLDSLPEVFLPGMLIEITIP